MALYNFGHFALHACSMHSITFEPCMLWFQNFIYGFLVKKIDDAYFFSSVLFSELRPFEKERMKSCQQNI